MNKLPFSKLKLGPTSPSFFSNRALISLKSEFNQSAFKPTRGPFLSNIHSPILQSSTNPFKQIKDLINSNKFGRQWSKQFTKSFNSSNFRGSAKKSDTWKNYNKHYGNSNWNRLKGPAIFTALFCGGTYFLVPIALNYTPLAVLKAPNLLVYSIIAINGAVFLMWRSGKFIHYLSRYGLLVKDNVYSNWSLLGSAFSHQSFTHLFFNMYVLQSFGTSLCAMIGSPMFLLLYLQSAVLSSFISIVIPTLMRSSLVVGSLGASGAIFSVLAAFSYLVPKAPIAIFFIPVPGGAWFAFLITVAYNCAGLFFRWGQYDYAAHLGGSIVGVVYGWWIQRKVDSQRQIRYRNRSLGF